MNTTSELGLSEVEIDTLQREAWTETCRHVTAHSPFYREHWRRAGLPLDADLPLSRIEEIPPIDKNTISDLADAFLCVPERRVVDIVTTSGSTGRPLVWKLTEADLERLALNEALSFQCAGFSAADRVILAVALDRCFIAGMAYFLGLRKLGCSILRVGPSTPTLHVDLMRRLEPTAVVGVPSFLCLVARKAAESGVRLGDLGVRKAACIGESVREADLTLNRTGERIEQEWQARVFSTYGNTELASSWCECDAGAGGHLHSSLLFLEALDEQGRRVPDGQTGELTATTFGVEGMPLVRYRTGDYAAIHREPCRCGRRTPRIGPILGRKQQKLKIKGTTIFPSTLKSVLDSVPEVSAYVIIARREDQLSDAVEVKVACAADAGPLLRTLRDRFRAEAKVVPRLTEASAAEIERLQMPEESRKRRYFLDCRD